MVDTSRIYQAFAVVLVAATFGVHVSCGPNDPDRPILGESRALDEGCKNGGCKLEGAASITSGLTADTTGIVMGPGESSATITFPRGAPRFGYDWHIEILASGTGLFTVSEPPCNDGSSGNGKSPAPTELDPAADYQWLVLQQDCPAGTLGDTATFTIRGTQGSVLHIADVRIVNTFISSGGCY